MERWRATRPAAARVSPPTAPRVPAATPTTRAALARGVSRARRQARLPRLLRNHDIAPLLHHRSQHTRPPLLTALYQAHNPPPPTVVCTGIGTSFAIGIGIDVALASLQPTRTARAVQVLGRVPRKIVLHNQRHAATATATCA